MMFLDTAPVFTGVTRRHDVEGGFSSSYATVKELKRFVSFLCALTIMMLFLWEPETVIGAHFQAPSQTEQSQSCDFLGHIRIAGVDAKLGDEVAFFDRNGVLYGTGAINTAGQYGFLHVYGGEGEGLKEGDPLTIRVWDAERSIEWKGSCVVLSAGELPGSAVPSPLPPIWKAGGGFVLDIDTRVPPADLNGDCEITLADAILSLKIMSAAAEAIPPAAATAVAGIDGGQGIGLPEAIYILQTIAGIRN